MELKNFMEEAVKDVIDNVLKDLDVCKCDKCKLDIMALTLNNLPPKYYDTEKGEVYTKVNELKRQFEVDIISQITRSAFYVNQHRRHGEDIK
ncbi:MULTISPECIES: late competence development ComFB family protein [Thermoanaerobacterium]|uniref:Late competence development protein ComFB n=3 Tax=Thermoanaerobacterium TaxID=28895 RepID=W9EAX3_9THEO|nr:MULTISPECIES: late competence development ComFB family protein [Thermoanaerobacterium]ADK10918.1 ComFB [Thermoanaerobacterium saccharolyticum JW/SL-YS485]AFK86953.1 Late competence development protein ComFB [Thermoanaerobacterium saccharolyticum JW/SL-YS485]ETO39238.1 late competence development protein ComFB [Thermoanaerobacterium aotearoense SCUT27]